MDLCEIKESILALDDVMFSRFEKWFFKFGCNGIDKYAKSSKLRQSVLNLPDKNLDSFWEWYDDLCHERYVEEVKNDPISQDYLKLGYMIMSKPDPGQFLVDLFSCGATDNKKK